MTKELIKDYKINECYCGRDCCDEWSTTLDCEFYLKTPERFTLFGKEYVIDRILIEPHFLGLNGSYTEIEDLCCFKFAGSDIKFEAIEIPREFLKEIADIFKQLEDAKDKRLNDCFISDDIYGYLEEEDL